MPENSNKLVICIQHDIHSKVNIHVCLMILFSFMNVKKQKENKLKLISYDSAPFAIVLADFNNDSHLDIAITNGDAGNIGILIGYGNGTFGPQMTYSTGSISAPCSMTVADFDDDNRLDIAVTLFRTGDVAIYFGDGNGHFQRGRLYSTGVESGPYGIAVADLNNDQQLDIVITLKSISNIAVLIGYNAADLENETIYSTGSAPQPYSIVINDLNDDKRSDIIVANSGTNNVAVLFGFGNGTFGTQMMYSTGVDSHPQYVITGDWNDDNHPDIVTTNLKYDSISMLTGYDNGTFEIDAIYPNRIGSHPSAVIFGDINNDNRSDLVIVNTGTDSITILRGFDLVSFENQIKYQNANDLRPGAIITADFNDDNYLDIGATFYKSGNGNVAVLLGYGNGSFGVMMNYPTGNGSVPIALAVGDFNNDKRLDIAVANYLTNSIGILLGYDNGSFADIMISSTGVRSCPSTVVTRDFNDDGLLDVIVANPCADDVRILLGYGNGSFVIRGIYLTGNGSSSSTVAAGDFNNDSQMDFAVVNQKACTVGIFLGYGNGTFGSQNSYSSGFQSQPTSLELGDFNNDNYLDIVTTTSIGKYIGILLGYGNGTFAPVSIYITGGGSTSTCVGIGDLNNDKQLDIAVTSLNSDEVTVLYGFGDGKFFTGESYSTGTGSGPISLAIGDFNNDSRLDLAISKYLASEIGVFLGHVSAGLVAIKTYSTGIGSQPHAVAIDDFHDDGRADIILANYGTNNVGILLGEGDGDMGDMITYSTGVGSAPCSIAVGDFNHDNRSDIVVANCGTDNITLLLGFRNGTFAIGVTYSTGIGSRPSTVAIADINNDNMMDIGVTNSGTNNVILLYGYGNGTFGNEVSYPLGYDYRPYSIAVNDLNQDGWMDIVIACYGTDNVEILMKMC